MSTHTFMGYVRKDGSVGTRNYVAILPSVVCVNEVVESIVHNTNMTQGIIHHQGCCQTPGSGRTTECLIKIGQNPNVRAILIVSLGCEGVDTTASEAELRPPASRSTGSTSRSSAARAARSRSAWTRRRP